MILRLALAQARSQKRYTIWTAALLTFALTLTSFGLILLANQLVIQKDSARAWANDRDTQLIVTSGLGHDPADPTVTYEPVDSLPLETVERAIAQATAEGSDVVAVRRAYLGVDLPAGLPDLVGTGSRVDIDTPWEPYLEVLAVTGAYDWDVVLVEGSAPGPGEIALSSGKAEDLGLGRGDTITLANIWYWLGPDATSSPPVTYEISGLLKTCGDGLGYAPSCPGAFLAWEDSAAEGSPFTYPVDRPSDGVRIGWVLETWVYYTTDAPALTVFDPFAHGYGFGNWAGAVPPGTSFAIAFAALLVVGMIVVAFAVGRAQAQARLAWVATARTLGATRSAVVSASIVETLLVAAFSTAAALVLGVAAAVAHRAIHSAVVAHPFIPDSLSLPWWVFAGVASAGLALAVIVAVVPAFWAARVAPVAALKPVNDIMEAEVSRRVRVRWLLIPFVIGLAAMTVSFPSSIEGGDALAVGYVWSVDAYTLGWILAAVTGFALGLEGLRLAIPACGRWLSRRRPAWAIAAGDALSSRPRQGVAPALLLAFTLLLGARVITSAALNSFHEYWSEDPDGPWLNWREYTQGDIVGVSGRWVAVALAILIVVQVITLAIAFVGHWATDGESATRRALGLSAAGQRRATLVQHVTPQAIGATSGAVVGFVLAVFTHASYAQDPFSEAAVTSAQVREALGHAAAPCLLLVVLSFAVAALGGLIVAASTGTRTPVEALRPEG